MRALFSNLQKALLIVAATAIIFVTFGPAPASAIEIHEDPEKAETVFNGISLFRYYTASLDALLRKAPDEVEARLGKMPFANVPDGISRATAAFASSSTNLSYLVFDIDRDVSRLLSLSQQSRFDEASRLSETTRARIIDAGIRLSEAEQAVVVIGRELRVSSASAGTDLKRSYDEVMERIEKIKAMLASYKAMRTSQEEMMAKISSGRLLKRTQITLKVEPPAAFVGDNITFAGELTTEGAILAGREVDILLDGSANATALTDATGHFAGTLRLPYHYEPESELQAVYLPKGSDNGTYSAAVSPVVKLKILFYEGRLELTVPDKSYPGLETTIGGRFDYPDRVGTAPSQRMVEIYIDDVFIAGVDAGQTFTTRVNIAPEMLTGKHAVTFSATPKERYAPVTVSATLNVTRAVPVLAADLPGLALIPGSLHLEGRLSSEISSLSGAAVRMSFGRAKAEATTSADGSFDTRLGMGMGLSLAGWQELEIEVIPQEPWNAPTKITRSLFTVNILNSGGFVALLVFLGVYLPRRLRIKFGLEARPARKRSSQTQPALALQAATVRREHHSPTALATEAQGPRGMVLELYRQLVRLLERVTQAFLAPQQTLREFASEHARDLGPLAGYFVELSRIVERLLYSRHQPTPEELAKSEQITRDIQEAFKREAV